MTDIKQLSREAAQKIEPHLDPYFRLNSDWQEQIAAIIESVLTGSDLFREGYELAKKEAAKIVDVCTCGSGPEFRSMHFRHHAAFCLVHQSTFIRALTPDRKE